MSLAQPWRESDVVLDVRRCEFAPLLGLFGDICILVGGVILEEQDMGCQTPREVSARCRALAKTVHAISAASSMDIDSELPC